MSLVETAVVGCPYCGEANEIVVDTSIEWQEYVEDCAVCCQPMLLVVAIGEDGRIDVTARREND